MAEEKGDDLVWKVFLWGMAILLALCVTSVKTLFEKVDELHTKVVTIESSRCTAGDCADIRATVSSLRSTVAAFPNQIPPQWFLDKVNAMGRKLELLEERLWEGERRDDSTALKKSLPHH